MYLEKNKSFSPQLLIDRLMDSHTLNQVNPAVNIKELEKEFIIELATPGLKKEEFQIQFKDDLLSVKTNVNSEKSNDSLLYSKQGFDYSKFEKRFSIPETVNPESIKADYENGVLTLNLKKKDEVLPQPARQIEIN